MRLIYLIPLMLISSISYSQVEKGNVFIGGASNLGLSHQSFNRGAQTTQSIQVSPSIGLFLTKGFVGGLSLPINWTRYASHGSTTHKSTALGIAPFFRYYIDLEGKDFYPFFHLSAGKIFPNEIELSDFYLINGGPGLATFITKNITIDTGIRYTYYSRYSVRSNSPMHGVSLVLSLNFILNTTMTSL